jgi:uncharacterized protein YsxB (DUF464 family)
MIVITIDREALSIHAKGHAKGPRNEYGHDLVCAAVSALMQGYAYAGTRTGHIMEIMMDKGDMLARVDPDATVHEELRNIFRGYCLGLQLVAENRPECLRITGL